MHIGVSGASGNLGRAVMAELSRRAFGHHFVAVSRTPAPSTATVEGRHGDYDRPETLAEAYRGLDRLLIIPSADLRPGMRGAQATAAVDAAVAAGVGHVFLLSACGTRDRAEPAIGAAYWVGERSLVRSGIPAWTILRTNYFAETLIAEARMHADKGALVGLSENRVAYVSRDDVAAACAGALVTGEHAGATYNLTGPASLSGADRTGVISAASGKPMGYLAFPEQQFRSGIAEAGLPLSVIDVITSMQAALSEGAYDIVTGDVERLSGEPPRSFRDVANAAFKQ